MTTLASTREVYATPGSGASAPWLASAELLFVYAGILLYIWRWQFSFPLAWIPLLAAVLASHIARREGPRQLGLTGAELRASARIIFPLALAVYIPFIIYGIASARFPSPALSGRALMAFAAYVVWCCFQQYLAQSYFHRRLMRLTPNRHVSSLLVALMFGAAHIPNAILMAATFIGGLILAEVYARHPNIWPLAIAQAGGGLLISALAPAALIHHMRVGPGYFFYEVR